MSDLLLLTLADQNNVCLSEGFLRPHPLRMRGMRTWRPFTLYDAVLKRNFYWHGKLAYAPYLLNMICWTISMFGGVISIRKGYRPSWKENKRKFKKNKIIRGSAYIAGFARDLPYCYECWPNHVNDWPHSKMSTWWTSGGATQGLWCKWHHLLLRCCYKYVCVSYFKMNFSASVCFKCIDLDITSCDTGLLKKSNSAFAISQKKNLDIVM
jgi:hypothetical protein